MDQSAFRTILTQQTSTSSSASPRGRPAASSSSGGSGRGAFGGGRQRLGVGGTGGGHSRDFGGIPDATSQKSSLEQFKPRTKKLAIDVKGKQKAEDQEEVKSSEPTYRRYGYTDRASMRRAGLEEAEEKAEQEDRRPRGLDLSKLEASKRALLGVEEPPEKIDEKEADTAPPKTEEEVERELAEAEQSLKTQDDTLAGQASDAAKKQSIKEEEQQPPQKKQKKSRSEMLRDLQAKIAAATSGVTAETKIVETTPTGRKKEQPTAAAVPAVLKGFKAIARAPEKKKKKKQADASADSNGIAQVHPDGLTADLGKNTISTAAGIVEDAFDEDGDIFGGAGDYDDGLSADGDSAEEGEERENKPTVQDEGPIKYFDDQDEVIPKFETWRSPTPPLRERSHSPAVHNPYADGDEPPKPQRLEGFSTSQYSAKDLLEMDNALAREEKRKLKKLKGKDKKEAMSRLEELEGGKSAEQKDKDRLNKEAQEYENYEKKKQKRSRADS